MSDSNFWIMLGIRLLENAPFYLVWLVGIFIALFRWSRHSRLSLLVIVVFLLEILLRTFSVLLVQLITLQDGTLNGDLIQLYRILLPVAILLEGVLWICILWAIFGWRKPQRLK